MSISPTLLGHICTATGQTHYDQARMLDAGRRLLRERVGTAQASSVRRSMRISRKASDASDRNQFTWAYRSPHISE